MELAKRGSGFLAKRGIWPKSLVAFNYCLIPQEALRRKNAFSTLAVDCKTFRIRLLRGIVWRSLPPVSQRVSGLLAKCPNLPKKLVPFNYFLIFSTGSDVSIFGVLAGVQ